LRRTASFDVFSVKISLTDSPVVEFKYQKSVVNFEREGGIFHLYGEQTPWADWTQFFGGRRPRRNQAIQIWWRSVKGFWVGWWSKFAFSYTLKVVLTTLTLLMIAACLQPFSRYTRY